MASNAKNVYAAEPLAAGTCFVAPPGTPGPTSATDPLNVAFVDLGYIGEDGYTQTIDRSIDEKKAFGGDTVKILQTDFTVTFKFTFMESLKAEVLKAVYGEDNVTVTSANSSHGAQVKVAATSKKLPKQSWVIDTLDSTEVEEAFYRLYIPEGQITTVGDVTLVHTDVIMYEVEVKCFKDVTGAYFYAYTDDGQLGS